MMSKNALHTYEPSDRGGVDDERTDRNRDRPATRNRERRESEAGDGAGSSGEPVTAEDAPAISLDEIFGLLRNRRRRDVLSYLLEADGQISLGEVAETIAARECDKPVSQITSQERKRVYVGLYQGHLPKMDDYGAIEYNQERGVIDRGPNFELFVEYLPDEEEISGPNDDSSSLLEELLNIIT